MAQGGVVQGAAVVVASTGARCGWGGQPQATTGPFHSILFEGKPGSLVGVFAGAHMYMCTHMHAPWHGYTCRRAGRTQAAGMVTRSTGATGVWPMQPLLADSPPTTSHAPRELPPHPSGSGSPFRPHFHALSSNLRCDFGCAKRELDPANKFADSAPDRWTWEGGRSSRPAWADAWCGLQPLFYGLGWAVGHETEATSESADHTPAVTRMPLLQVWTWLRAVPQARAS